MSILRLDWKQLDPETFQQLVSELFMGILGWVRYKPGPLRGPDGGWDGLFRGVLPFDRVSELPAGLWMVDAKHYNPQRKTAYEQLRDKLRISTVPKGRGKSARPTEKSPIEKAIENRADYLLIVTSAELRADEADKLEALADGTSLKALRIMGRIPLEALVRERPWLLATYFGEGPSPLVPLHAWNPRVPEREALPYRPRTDFIEALTKVLAAPEAGPRAIVLHAPGGAGKSRLIDELDRTVGRQVLALQRGGRGSDAAAALMRMSRDGERGRWVIVVDDADRHFVDCVGPIANLITNERLDVVLLLTARTGPHADLAYRLETEANLEDVTLIPLPELSAEERLDLLRGAVGERGYDEEALEQVAKHCGTNLVLLAHAAAQLRCGRAALRFDDGDALVGEIPKRLVAEALAMLRGTPDDIARTLLATLAAVGDLWPEDVDRIAEHVSNRHQDVAPRDVLGWIAALTKKELLVEVGRSLTFRSDVEAELLLSELTKAGTRFFDPLLDAFGHRDRFVDNVVMLGLWGAGEAGMDLCRSLLALRRAALASADLWRCAEVLETASPLAQALPHEALDLVAVATSMAEDARPWERDKLAGAAGTVVTHALLAHDADGSVARRCFELAVDPSLRPRQEHHQDRVLGALIGALNPYQWGIEVPARLLTALEDLVRTRAKLTERERKLVVALIGRLVSPTIEYMRSSPSRSEVTHYTRALPATGPWLDLNRRAWELWQHIIVAHPDAGLRAALLEGMDRAGRDSGYVQSDLRKQSIERRLQLLGDLAETVADERNLEALAAIQKAALWHWIRLEEDPPERGGALSEPARHVLERIPRTLELNLYACLWTPNAAIDDVEQLAALPAHERHDYGWFSDEHIVATHRRVADAVLAAASTPGALVHLLGRVGRADVERGGGVPAVIVLLVRDGYRIVDAIMRDPETRRRLPPEIDGMLERVWSELAADGLERLIERIGDLQHCSPDDAQKVAAAAVVEARRGHVEAALDALTAVAAHVDEIGRASL